MHLDHPRGDAAGYKDAGLRLGCNNACEAGRDTLDTVGVLWAEAHEETKGPRQVCTRCPQLEPLTLRVQTPIPTYGGKLPFGSGHNDWAEERVPC